jgi:hypothetical protein
VVVVLLEVVGLEEGMILELNEDELIDVEKLGDEMVVELEDDKEVGELDELEEDVIVEELLILEMLLEIEIDVEFDDTEGDEVDGLLELVEGVREEGPLVDGTDGMVAAFAQPTIKMLRSVTPNKLLLFFKMISPN